MASGVERSDGVAVTGFASLNRVRYGLELLKWSKLIDLSRLSALQVKVPVGALLAVPADDVWLAEAVARVTVADGQRRLLVQVRADGVALAGLAAGRVARLLEGEGIAEEARLAALAVEAVGVVDAAEALARRAVAVPNGVGVNVVVAVAPRAGADRAVLSHGVPEVAVLAELAPRACVYWV